MIKMGLVFHNKGSIRFYLDIKKFLISALQREDIDYKKIGFTVTKFPKEKKIVLEFKDNE